MQITFGNTGAFSPAASRKAAPSPAKSEHESDAAVVQDEVVLSEAANPRVGTFRPNHTKAYQSALRLCAAMAALNIPCAVAGGLATTAHGYQRSTPDVDVILTPEGLNDFKDWGVGRGWVERYPGSRNLRDTSADVGVDIILTTDGPVNVPSPTSTVTNPDGLPVLSLPKLIELKLSTSTLNEKRTKKDLNDVKGLIWSNELGVDYAQNLSPTHREQFQELCAD